MVTYRHCSRFPAPLQHPFIYIRLVSTKYPLNHELYAHLLACTSWDLYTDFEVLPRRGGACSSVQGGEVAAPVLRSSRGAMSVAPMRCFLPQRPGQWARLLPPPRVSGLGAWPSSHSPQYATISIKKIKLLILICLGFYESVCVFVEFR